MRRNAAVRIFLLNGFIAVLMLLTACNSGTHHDTYTFSGEGEHWSAIYSETVTEEPALAKGEMLTIRHPASIIFSWPIKGKPKT